MPSNTRAQICTMPGSLIDAAAFASLKNRRTISALCDSSGRSSFTTASRCITACLAAHTAPMPPSASSPVTWYPPTVVPIIEDSSYGIGRAAAGISGIAYDTRVSLHTRAWRVLAGEDGPEKPGLPLAELLAPLPLLAIAVLFVNDWILKPLSPALPFWLTGKLSDFAGLAVFPLVATAAFDVVLWIAWRAGANVDFTLRRWKLAIAIALTGGVFSLMKLVPEIALLVARAIGVAFSGARVMPDPTDLIALPALAFAWWWGNKTIARGAYGRLAWAARARPATIYEGAALDVPARTWLDTGDSAPISAALAKARR